MKKYARLFIAYLIGVFMAMAAVYLIDIFGPHAGNRPVYIPPATSVVDKQFNFHVVAPGVWRSANTTEEGLRRMRRHGLKTIISLRASGGHVDWEKKLAEELGIRFYHFPMDARQKPDDAQLADVLKVMANKANQPVLLHCYGGKDRTGLVAGLYQLLYRDAALEDVHREMLMYGYDQERYPLVYATLKEWARRYSSLNEKESPNPRPVSQKE